MPRTHMHDPSETHDPPDAAAVVPAALHTNYLVERREDAWFIAFSGEEFGPYKTEREALLFAIDAAYKLGETGEDTQVLLVDESGDARPAWTYGQDPYPPRQ
jgi:hypothetical protein